MIKELTTQEVSACSGGVDSEEKESPQIIILVISCVAVLASITPIVLMISPEDTRFKKAVAVASMFTVGAIAYNKLWRLYKEQGSI